MHVAVIDVLQRASSQDPNILKSAEETLKQWETERGFYISLHVSITTICFNILIYYVPWNLTRIIHFMNSL